MREKRTREFNLQESMLARTKKHKKKAFPHAVIGTIISLLILLSVNWWPTPDVASVASDDENAFTASFVGDIMTGRYVEQVIDHRGEDALFQYARPYFDEADYVTGNLENPILRDGKAYEPEDKEIHLEGGEQTVGILADAGFSNVNLANNHMRDYGSEGLQDTLAAFEDPDVGVDTVGAYFGQEEQAMSMEEHDDLTVATVGFNDVWPAIGRGGVSDANPSESLDDIQEADDQADLVVAHLHSGVEYSSTVTDRQEELMKAYVDAGADIVVGHHPHVLQSVDVYNDGIIFYSLGNFVFDQGWTRARDTVLAQYELGEDGMAEIELVPFRVHEAQPRPLDGMAEPYYRERIFQQLTKDTSDDSTYEQSDGRLVFEVDHGHVLE